MSGLLFEFISPATGSMDEVETLVKDEPLLKHESPEELSDQYKCGEIFTAFSGNFILICGFCNNKFENMLEFGSHIQEMHKDYIKEINEYLKSKIDLNGAFTKYEAEVTKESSEGTLYSLEDVVEPKTDVDSDGDHCVYEAVEAEITETRENFSCSACGLRFDTKQDLRTHYNAKECTRLKTESVVNRQTRKRTSDRQKRQKKRKIGVKIEREAELSEDNQDDIPLTEIRDSLKVAKEKPLTSESSKKFPCEICDRVFKSRPSLSCHVARGHRHALQEPDLNPEDPSYLRCKFCNEETPTRQECIEHEKTHTGDKPYMCWHCNLTFKTSSGRKRHVRIHTGERPFQCDECPKGFDSKEQLESHMNKHKNPRKFTCQTCGETFFRRFQLGLHEQRRHTGFRPLVCEDCGKSFVTMGELTQHRIRHSDVKDWKCEVCGKCFYSKWALKDHMAGHSDAKPFGCEVCGRLFSRPKALKKHKKLHSDVKAYVCNICGKAYAQDSGLYAHKKTHGIRSSQ